MFRHLLRVANVPVRKRFYQAANSVLITAVGKRLGIIHLIEYPKCGGTWVRQMVQSYLGVPHYSLDRFVTRNTVVQVHCLYRSSIRTAIVVVRDPRDVLVSQYYFATSYAARYQVSGEEAYFTHDPERPLRDDFSAYVEARMRHVTYPRFSYREFLDSWLERTNVVVVRYEDCLEDAATQLVRVVRFLGREIDDARIRIAVEENTFENRTKARTGRARKRGEADATQFERKGIAGGLEKSF